MAILGTLHRGAVRRCVLGALLVVLAPWPAMAGDRFPAHTPLRTALADLRVAEPSALRPRPPAARQAQPANPATSSPAFFKTRTGVLVAVVMGLGAGYAIYSAQHDRIHSAGKK